MDVLWQRRGSHVTPKALTPVWHLPQVPAHPATIAVPGGLGRVRTDTRGGGGAWDPFANRPPWGGRKFAALPDAFPSEATSDNNKQPAKL